MRIQPKMDILVKIGTIVVAVVAMIVDVLTVGIVTLVMFAKLIIKGIEMDYKYFELSLNFYCANERIHNESRI